MRSLFGVLDSVPYPCRTAKTLALLPLVISHANRAALHRLACFANRLAALASVVWGAFCVFHARMIAHLQKLVDNVCLRIYINTIEQRNGTGESTMIDITNVRECNLTEAEKKLHRLMHKVSAMEDVHGACGIETIASHNVKCSPVFNREGTFKTWKFIVDGRLTKFSAVAEIARNAA